MLFTIEEPVTGAIWHLLNHYCLEDAIFLAERLHAEVNSDESTFLLATCYFRDGQKIHAMHTLEKLKVPSVKCRVLLARCYIEQKEYRRVQHVLLGTPEIPYWEVPRVYKNDAGVVFWLAGESLRRSNLPEEAREYFLHSLEYNPYMWSSLHALCEIGHPVPLKDIYVVSNFPVFCNEACFMAVSRSVHPCNSEDKMEVQQQVQQQVQRSRIRPPISQPQSSDVTRATRKTNLSKVCMKLSFESAAYNEKRMSRNVSNSSIESPSTPRFGTLPLLATPDQEQELPGLERSGNVTWLFQQLKETHLFSSCLTPAPQPLSFRRSPPRRVFISKGFEKECPNLVKSVLAANSSRDFITPDLQTRHSRKRDPQFLPSGTTEESEPKSKVRRQEPSKLNARPDRPVTRSFLRQEPLLFSASALASPSSLPHSSESKLPVPSKIPARSRRGDRLAETKAQSKLVQSISNVSLRGPAQTTTSPLLPAGDTSTLLDSLQTEELNSALKSSLQSIADLMLQLATGYTLLYQFQLEASVKAFEDLPDNQCKTPWVLCQVAKAHFERASYQAALKLFESVRSMDIDHVTDMDIYSTTLWHLQKDVELSALSEELSDSWYLSPQAWIAKGNCLSLNKEHEDAIKFFRRATQVAPRFVYAYTLLGHEYLCTEDLSSARKSFRTAATINPRHYNAFFGLGMISLREENFQMAELHFNKANLINSSSCIICSRLAKVKHSLHRSSEALVFLERARKLDPKNPVPLYHKATILLDLNRPQESLTILEDLTKMVPREALVHFLMGKVYHKLGKKYEAKLKYSWALSIDPNNREIRDAQNSLNQPSNQDEGTPPNSRFDIFIDPMPETPTPNENQS